jgi:hypothetical protein
MQKRSRPSAWSRSRGCGCIYDRSTGTKLTFAGLYRRGAWRGRRRRFGAEGIDGELCRGERVGEAAAKGAGMLRTHDDACTAAGRSSTTTTGLTVTSK